ncbi:MAG: right-handed parallel beta-helix repeat-containing protein [Leifsonia sp.]
MALAALGLPALAAAAPVSYENDQQIVSDPLDRVQQNGWGTAPVGGAYSLSSPQAFSDNGTAGVAAVPHAGASLSASLPAATASDADASTVVSVPAVPTTGNGVYAGVQLRSAAGSYYQGTIRVDTKARVLLSISRVNHSTADQTVIAAEKVVAQGVTAGQKIAVDFRVTGTDTVNASARAWFASQTAPDWQLTGSDSTDKRLSGAGSVGLWTYVSSGSQTTAVSFDAVSAYSLKAVPNGQPTPPSTTTPTPTPTPTSTPTTPATPPSQPTPPTTPTPPTSSAGDPTIDQSAARSATGAAPIGSAAYPVPAGAYFVAPTGSDAVSRATEGTPWQSVQHAVDSVPSGSTIVLRAGTYHETVTIPRGKTVTIQPYPKEAVWFDGSRTVSNWTPSGSTWVANNWNVSFDDSPTYTRGAPDGTQAGWAFVNPAYPMAAHPDQVFVNGTALAQVASRSAVTAGTFFVDTAAKQLVLGTDPSGKQVQSSDTVKAFTVLGDGSVLRGFGVRRYSPSVPDMGALQVYATGVTLENLAITDNATTGFAFGAINGTVTNVTVARNGMLGGTATYADGLKVSGLLAADNNTEHFNRAPVAGGLKIARSRNITVTGSNFLGNAGNALWFDESVYNVTVADSNIVGNSGNALVAEISAKFAIANNLIADNGIAGILVSDTGTVDIRNNTITGNQRDINITQGTRRASQLSTAGHDPRQSLPDPTVTWITGNISVINNVLAKSTGDAILAVEDYSHQHSAAQMGITTNGNIYQRPSTSLPTWSVIWSRGAGNPAVYNTLADFTAATGQDASSRAVDGSEVLTGKTQLVPSLSSATGALGQPLSATVAALTGKPVGAVQVGAWPF